MTSAPQLPAEDGPRTDDTLLSRRKALGVLAGGGLAIGVAAATGVAGAATRRQRRGATTTTTVRQTTTTAAAPTTTTTAAPTTTTTAAPTTTTPSSGTVTVAGRIPAETAGPYPADGTNGPNVLTQTGVVRSDLRTSVGSAAGTATGIPLTVELTLANASTGAVLPGYAVYLWHCDSQGRYSLYSNGLAGENHLRGVQVADATGVLRFTTVFPGAYSGRWPHLHFEVFDALTKATTGRNATRTSQLALPAAVCQEVYATSGYASSARNLAGSNLSTDNVFRDGVDLQMATVTGSTTSGYTARLTVGL